MPRTRLRVGVLGGTGTVGQKLVALLADHPWFELTALAASPRSAGMRYRDAVRWLEPAPLPEHAGALELCPASPPLDCDFVVSALDADAAMKIEPRFAEAGLPVVSNASAFRMERDVPLVVPEVNPDHLDLVHAQRFDGGFIVTNPNCVTAGLVLALKPLVDAFGVEAVNVTTMQALSGAGYPGVPSLDALANVIPFIAGEEEKIAAEPRKILGRLAVGGVAPADIAISAQATRVPVLDGHVLSVAVRLSGRATEAEVREALAGWRSPIAGLGLPSAPERPLHLWIDAASPQPRLHAALGRGMTVSVGRVRRCPVLGVRFVALVHNTIRGGAGAALLNAELLVERGMLGTRGARRKRKSADVIQLGPSG